MHTPPKCVRLVATLTLVTLGHSALGASGKETRALRRMRYTSRSPVKATAWQKDVRLQLLDVMKMSDLTKANIPFKPKTLATESHRGYALRELSIQSTPGRRIKIILTLPDAQKGPLARKGPFPAVVCIHGHGGSRRAVHDRKSIYKGFAAVLAERGVVTVSTDVGRHKVYEKGRSLMGERLWDVMRCVDYVASLASVDKSRIGCAGLSLGGEMAMWLGAMDERIAATVSCGFLTVMDQMEKNHCMCWKFPGLRERVDYADIYSLTAPRPLQCQNGRKEGKTQFHVPIARKALAEIKPIYNDFAKPKNVELHVHPGGHEVDLPALMKFFTKHLSIPPAPK